MNYKSYVLKTKHTVGYLISYVLSIDQLILIDLQFEKLLGNITTLQLTQPY